VVPNTLRALCLTELARDLGLHRAIHDRLMHAYWDEALDIGDADVLYDLSLELGRDRSDVEAAIAGGPFADRVRVSTAEAQSLGVTGVPAFVLDRKLMVLGAQPREVFEHAISVLDENRGPS
jgi:predicted DsbA family dithiol-disulfide isomerase